MVALQQLSPVTVPHYGGALGRAGDVREQYGRVDAIAPRRRAGAGEERLDLACGLVHVPGEDHRPVPGKFHQLGVGQGGSQRPGVVEGKDGVRRPGDALSCVS
jgi:hypothetical protein